MKRLRREGGEVVARQVDLLEDLQVGEGAFVDCLDVRLLEADLLKVVQAERTEDVFGKLLQIVSIHDEHLKRKKVNSNISYFKTIIKPDITEVFSTSFETPFLPFIGIFTMFASFTKKCSFFLLLLLT